MVVSDFLGLGQSDKPTVGTFETYYSLIKKADQLIEIANRDGLTKLSAPKTVCWGEQDINAKVEMAYKMKELNPDIDLHIWKACAYWPPIEVPERWARAIVDRLD